MTHLPSPSISFAALTLTFLSACAITPPLEKDVCTSLKIWIEAGPRNTTNDRRLIMPNSSNCYNASGPDEIVLTCLTTNFDCPDGVKCEDSADMMFRKALYRPAHYWTEYDYFEVFNICLGTLKKRTQWASREIEQNQSFNTSYRNNEISLVYDADEIEASMVVSYSDSR